ncbi:heat-inducible transcriptional repressor HrcA [Leucobacter sp. M11]|uniref:heat-inducible transcriptional repressor HrcA n=1 Tax=Leucobacter sp. M11 TaxID=2993565 RepID=UPI002D80C707|nr:heat-inducible transcriptional repressor HrcA [Leucobacter sp. M11]MEB4616654.1 heat-inducible transcriptional repressor HrcA [Leucobacter sp. M11]
MVTDRGLDVLRAIVNDYVSSHEPVGSKAIVDRHNFGVSAATIRNDMAMLEDEELIVAPHTSSGRVPTDKGYRLYVDTLAEVRPLSVAQRRAIERFLGESEDLDDALSRTVRLLAQLTNQVAVVQYPTLRRAVIRHLELVPVGENRVLCVLITGTGVVEQHVARLPAARVSEAWVSGLRDRVMGEIMGHDLEAAATRLDALDADLETWADPADGTIIRSVLAVIAEQIRSNRSDRIALAGTANLLRSGHEFAANVTPVLEAIEEQVALLRLVSELVTDGEIVRASIGRENAQYGLPETAVLASRYEGGDDSSARLAVLGPMQMDYAGNIASVRAVARYLSKLLASND